MAKIFLIYLRDVDLDLSMSWQTRVSRYLGVAEDP